VGRRVLRSGLGSWPTGNPGCQCSNRSVVLVNILSVTAHVDEELDLRSVTVIDHHKTAFEMFERPAEGSVTFAIGGCSIHLDMDRSGATMALDHWKPTGLTDAQRQLFLYVEDGDLWRWKLPHSREFYAGGSRSTVPDIACMTTSLSYVRFPNSRRTAEA
jgi:oligoribonuclease NrnB/cAMP/cGMP phosphodiesterase (DHH superfamily)